MASLSIEDHDATNRPGTAQPYRPPSQFKLLDLPPLVDEAASDLTELWLIRISDNHLGQDDFKSKQVTMRLRSSDGKLGQFQSLKGNLYDIVALEHMDEVQPFAFLPNASEIPLHARKISRQVSFVRSLDLEVESIKPTAQESELLEEKDGEKSSRTKSISNSRPTASLDVSTLESLHEDQRVTIAHLGQVYGNIEESKSGNKGSPSSKRPIQEKLSIESDADKPPRKQRKGKKARNIRGD